MKGNKLKEWMEDVEDHAKATDQSNHDALCDLNEQSRNPLTSAESIELIALMD